MPYVTLKISWESRVYGGTEIPSPFFVNSQPSKPHLHGVHHGPIAANLNSLNRTLSIWDWHIQGKNKRSKSHPPLLKLATRIFSIRFWVAIMVKPLNQYQLSSTSPATNWPHQWHHSIVVTIHHVMTPWNCAMSGVPATAPGALRLIWCDFLVKLVESSIFRPFEPSLVLLGSECIKSH